MWLMIIAGEAYLLDHGFGPVRIIFFCPVFTPVSCVAKESRPQHYIIVCFEYIFFVLTVICGEIFTWVGYLFTDLFL